MYSLRQACLALSRPKLALREINKLYFSLRYGEGYNHKGVDIFEEEWDNLFILDSFRYDVFEETYREYDLGGTLEQRTSRGAATHEFLRGNVADRDLHDTVYVTASPHYYKHDDIRGEFHDVIHVWEEEGVPNARSQPPDTMAEYALRAAEEYPEKRLLLHFVQPHCPFLGEFGRSNFEQVEWVNHVGLGNTKGDDVSQEAVWKAYEENVDIVLPHVSELMEELSGLNVVTADHGQLLGDNQFPLPLTDYGHPEGVYVDTLVKVPWLLDQNGERKTIRPEPPIENDRNQDLEEAAEETLRELGYLG